MRDTIEFDEIDEHGPQDYSGTYDVTAEELAREEVTNLSRVKAAAHVDAGNTTGEYIADGTVEFTADFECSRCAEPFPFAATSTFHIRFQPRPDGTVEGEEVEITDESELDVEFYTERSLPLRELAVEQVQLSIPMKPLCNDNCLGLCPECGVNRNREKCNCEAAHVDERWGALAEIRDQIAKKNNN